eukprot:scaffold650598_cov53-Prasinocladus_malaysianus.AAC.1
MARKKKGKGEQDVEAVLNEYDKDMGSKETAYREELAVYERVVAQLEVQNVASSGSDASTSHFLKLDIEKL